MVIHVLYVCKIQFNSVLFINLIIFISDSMALIIIYSVYYLACKQNEDKKMRVSNLCVICMYKFIYKHRISSTSLSMSF